MAGEIVGGMMTYGQIAGLGAVEDLVHIVGGATEQIQDP
jgi:hypothetical protein